MPEDTVENETPDFVLAPFTSLASIVETYGWFILLGFIIIVYFYQKYKPSYEGWLKKQEELQSQQEAKKNPDKTYEVQVAVEQARLKLQQQVTTDAHKKRLKQEKLDEEKRKKKIEEWEKHKEGKGYHSKHQSQDASSNLNENVAKPKKKQTLRSIDYNPLMGDGGASCSFRPGRRNVSGGG